MMLNFDCRPSGLYEMDKKDFDPLAEQILPQCSLQAVARLRGRCLFPQDTFIRALSFAI